VPELTLAPFQKGVFKLRRQRAENPPISRSSSATMTEGTGRWMVTVPEGPGPGIKQASRRNGSQSPTGHAMDQTSSSSESELLCPQCEEQVQVDWVLCAYCGETLPKVVEELELGCPQCGEHVQNDWHVCPYCSQGLPEVVEESPGSDEEHGGTEGLIASPSEVDSEPHVADGTTFMLVALGLVVAALFVPFGSSTGSKSLASIPSDLLYNLPLLIVLVGAVLLRRAEATRQASVTVGLLGVVWWAVAVTNEVIGTITHQATLGIGAKLSITGVVLALISTVLGWTVAPLTLRVRFDALIWAGVSAVLAAGWVIGTWMPWTSTDWHTNTPGFTFPSTGTKDVVTSCCVAFRNQTMPNNVRQALIMAFVLVAAITVAFLVPRSLAGIALLTIGVLYLADPLSWLYQIARSNPNAVSLGGFSAKVVQSGQITASVSGMPGGWITLAAAFGLIVLGIFRLISSFAPSSDARPEVTYATLS